MISIFVAILCIFPISFFAYVLSERMNAVHQARVGRAIGFGSYFFQSWSDTRSDLANAKNKWIFLFYLAQLSIVFFLDFDLELVFPAYLILNALLLVIQSDRSLDAVENRVISDREQMKYLVATILSFISALACFVNSGSTSLATVIWSPVYLVFLPFFLVAGMILLGEYPFVALHKRSQWIDSSRFYVWCVLAAKLFLGGGIFVIDLHLKAILLFVTFRLIASYFPQYTQKDVFRLSVVYLIPISIVLWLLATIIHGVLSSGGIYV